MAFIFLIIVLANTEVNEIFVVGKIVIWISSHDICSYCSITAFTKIKIVEIIASVFYVYLVRRLVVFLSIRQSVPYHRTIMVFLWNQNNSTFIYSSFVCYSIIVPGEKNCHQITLRMTLLLLDICNLYHSIITCYLQPILLHYYLIFTNYIIYNYLIFAIYIMTLLLVIFKLYYYIITWYLQYILLHYYLIFAVYFITSLLVICNPYYYTISWYLQLLLDIWNLIIYIIKMIYCWNDIL